MTDRKPEDVIAEALKHTRAKKRVGQSLAGYLAQALRDAGMLAEPGEYDYTTADYDGIPSDENFRSWGQAPKEIAKYRRRKAGPWERIVND